MHSVHHWSCVWPIYPSRDMDQWVLAFRLFPPAMGVVIHFLVAGTKYPMENQLKKAKAYFGSRSEVKQFIRQGRQGGRRVKPQ